MRRRPATPRRLARRRRTRRPLLPTRERARRSSPCYDRRVRLRRVAVLVACGVIAAAGMWWIGGAIAGDAPVAPSPDAHVVTEAARTGRHVRIDGPRGAIHVW